MVPLCYVMLRASFVQLQGWLSHSILQNPLALSCPGFFCALHYNDWMYDLQELQKSLWLLVVESPDQKAL